MSSNVELRKIGFGKLVLESLPEMWGYQLVVGLILAIPATVLLRMINSLAGVRSGALTSANFREAMNWRLPLILLLGLILVFTYVAIEIFSHIHFADDILNGHTHSIFMRIWCGIKNFKKFACLEGVLVLLFIFIAVPLCGIGFSIRLSSTFKIPNFIMDVVISTPMYFALYMVIILIFLWIAYTSMFMIHAMVIDQLPVKEARKKSAEIIKKHGRIVLWEVLKIVLIIAAISLLTEILFLYLPELWLQSIARDLPPSFSFDIASKSSVSEINQMEWMVIGYRFLSALIVVLGTYVVSVVGLICGSFFMLGFTSLYYRFTERTENLYPERPKKSGYIMKVVFSFIAMAVAIFASAFIGLFFDQYFYTGKNVDVIAHRAGGFAATENSLEGLQIAIDNHVYGSEIDVQKTRDKQYIINHDNTFKRLAGVNRTAGDMSFSEIQELRIKDAYSKGVETKVPSFEEMLVNSKSKIKLFIELKGAGVDEEMANDVVKMVRDYQASEDVAIISLNYEIIDYVERTYPDLDTGVLFFAGLGDITKLNCDMLIMEEEFAGSDRIESVQRAGKKAIVWTVNTAESMRKFLDSKVDAVITDDIFLAKKVQTELDQRSDLELIRDSFSGFWEY